ncbi:hypothetical protein HMPREF0381_0272 [Lachnoanaerobaculum saburreum DSM 3986]|uniref:Uncharacterized protein n=1 Tax=Lachnoanaerobaculum saburreum DSM 3986 TaxID=887325 RepID=E6LK09_9FIRM|nr:hypothetical protein HMPREF0381_0272 [Lachnoanaerobaculum saburreum DSM 3986]
MNNLCVDSMLFLIALFWLFIRIIFSNIDMLLFVFIVISI